MSLVNEAYLRLIELKQVRRQDCAHFFGITTQLMWRILVDIARSRASQKRGGKSDQHHLREPPRNRRRQGVVQFATAYFSLPTRQDETQWILRLVHNLSPIRHREVKVPVTDFAGL
jgi:hypothetical protein